MAKTYHIVRFLNGWMVKAEGAKKFALIASRQSDAIAYAKGIIESKGGGVVIHRRDGSVRSTITPSSK